VCKPTRLPLEESLCLIRLRRQPKLRGFIACVSNEQLIAASGLGNS